MSCLAVPIGDCRPENLRWINWGNMFKWVDSGGETATLEYFPTGVFAWNGFSLTFHQVNQELDDSIISIDRYLVAIPEPFLVAEATVAYGACRLNGRPRQSGKRGLNQKNGRYEVEGIAVGIIRSSM